MRQIFPNRRLRPGIWLRRSRWIFWKICCRPDAASGAFALFSKILPDPVHALSLPDMERAPRITMPAVDTVPRLFIQRGRTRLAMAAVHAGSVHFLRDKRSQDRIILFLLRRIDKTEDALQVFLIPHARKHRSSWCQSPSHLSVPLREGVSCIPS